MSSIQADSAPERARPSGTASVIESARPCSGVALLRAAFLADPSGTDLSSLRPAVGRSWRRSVVSNAAEAGRDADPARRRPEIDQRVIDNAEPAIRMLLRATRAHAGCVVIADRFGTVASLRGDRSAVRWAERCYAMPGEPLAEDVAGTNCIGTAIEEQRGVTIAGAEHLSPRRDGCWTASTRVRDPLRRSVRALLGLVLPLEAVEQLDPDGLTALLDRAGAEVMDLLAARLAAREQALLTAYLRQQRKRGAHAVMAVDGRTTIANHGALELVGAREQAVIAAYAQEAQRARVATQRGLVLDDGSTVALHIEPVLWSGEPVGSVVHLRAVASPSDAPRHGSAALRVDPFAALVGESRGFARAMGLAQRAVDRGVPVHVIGERGTGKRALAMAMARARGDEPLCLDGQAPAADLVAVAVSMLDRGGTVVLVHADLLEEAVWSELAHARSFGKLILTARPRRLPDRALAFCQAIGSMEIELPALRARRDDTPALVVAFLAEAGQAPRRVSSRLVKLLTEAELPGNVAQLREIVSSAALRCSTAELSTDDLTVEHRQALMQTALSPLQTAEAIQIREALREAQGNRVRAAEILRIGRSTLYRRLDMYTRLGFEL